MKRLKFVGPAAFLMFAALTWHPLAYSQSTVMQGDALNKNSLVRALKPLPPGVRTRGISLRKKPVAAGSASVLITFKTNSAEISEAARGDLDIVASALKSDELTGFRFSIEGHADPRGEADFNLRLSQQRAESVARYLSDNHSVELNRLIPVGKGDTELMRPDQPAAPENRRVTIRTQRQ